jgi:hypothetical protein
MLRCYPFAVADSRQGSGYEQAGSAVLRVFQSIAVELAILVAIYSFADRCKGCRIAALALAWNLLR